jgi:hypothetical protein
MNTIEALSGRTAGSLAAAALVCAIAAPASAHEGDTATAGSQPPPAAAILQLEAARQAAARFLDVDQAVAEGYVDIGLFIPNMGWHYLKEGLLDAEFNPTEPELLVYEDDPCGGPRRLVAVEYAVPFALSKKAPAGFAGQADAWSANVAFELWTLHAWVFEYNPDGVFAPNNPRIP